MKIPTKKHLLSIGTDNILVCGAIWEPYGRKPWRLAWKGEDGIEFMRDVPSDRVPAGLPYEFMTGAQAWEFKDKCLAKLGYVPV